MIVDVVLVVITVLDMVLVLISVLGVVLGVVTVLVVVLILISTSDVVLSVDGRRHSFLVVCERLCWSSPTYAVDGVSRSVQEGNQLLLVLAARLPHLPDRPPSIGSHVFF